MGPKIEEGSSDTWLDMPSNEGSQSYQRIKCRIAAEMCAGGPLGRNRLPYNLPEIELLPHQLDTVERATRQRPVRMILADEPGLGKTIEAGLIMLKLIQEGAVQRILIVAPASVLTQWKSELQHKIGLDSEVVMASGEPSDDSFVHDICIVSMDYFARHYQIIAGCGWDLLILDEAHHFSRRFEGQYPIMRYIAAREASKTIENALFLTATPFQLSLYDLWSLLNLIRPEIFPDVDSLKSYVDYILPELRKAKTEATEGNDCEKILRRIESMERRFYGFETSPDGSVQQRILRSDLLSNIIIRHRKRDELPLVKREVRTIQVNYTDIEKEVYDNVIRELVELRKEAGERGYSFYAVILRQLLASSSRALLTSIRKRKVILEREDEDSADELEINPSVTELAILERIEEQVKAIDVDSKVRTLVAFLTRTFAQNPNAKIIIFTRFIATQLYILRVLKKQWKNDVDIFNGSMSLQLKDSIIEDFKDRGKILICTEAGGEGRNLQFCNILINYDLQWNPVRLEQRIGRIDRIGQRKDVFIFNLATWNTVEQDMYERLMQRIEEWSRTLGYIDPILGEIEDDINRLDVTSEEAADTMRKLLEEKLQKSEAAASKYLGLFAIEQLVYSEAIRCELRSGPTPEDLSALTGASGTLPDKAIRQAISDKEECIFLKSSHNQGKTIYILVKDIDTGAVSLLAKHTLGFEQACFVDLPKEGSIILPTDSQLMDLKGEADYACLRAAALTGFRHISLRPIVSLAVIP